MSSVGEISVDIKANTKSFDKELTRGVAKALDGLAKTLLTSTRSLERTFQQTAKTMNDALARVNGDKFNAATSAASTASRSVQSAMGEAAKAADSALAAVDGNDFDAVQSGADAAAGDVVSAFESAADVADSALMDVDGGGFDEASGAAGSAADEVASAFESAADLSDSALTGVDGGGFAEVSAAADSAGDEIFNVFESAADVSDAALGSIDGNGFSELTGAADSAASELVATFEGAADAMAASFDFPVSISNDSFGQIGGGGALALGALGGGVSGVGKDFDEFGKKSKRGLGTAALGIGAVIGLVKGGMGFVKAGEAANTANARIEQIGTSMDMFGDETKIVSRRLIDFAAVQARRTGADRNAIKEGQALMLTFREIGQTADDAGGNFDRATLAAIDLAAAGFGSVQSNSIQLGKALNDPIKGMAALSRSGVTFTDVEKEMIKEMVEANNILGAQDFILSAIEGQVQGTAEATRNSSDVMAESFSAVKEAVGIVLVPAFDGLANALGNTVLPAIESVILSLNDDFTKAVNNGATRSEAFKIVAEGAFDKVTRRMGVSRTAVRQFKDALGLVVGVVNEVKDAIGEQLEPVLTTLKDLLNENRDLVFMFAGIFAGAATTVLTVKTALMAVVIAAKLAGVALAVMGGPVTLIVAGVALLVAGLVLAFRRFEGFRNIVLKVVDVVKKFAIAAWPLLQAAFEGVIDSAKRVGEFLLRTWEGFREVIDAVLPPVFAALGELANWIDVNFISTVEAGLEFLFAVWGLFEPVLKRVFDTVKRVLDLVFGVISGWVKIVVPILQFWFDLVMTGFKVAFEVVELIVRQVFGGIKIFIQTILGVIRGVFKVFTGIFTGDFDKAFEGIKTIFESIWNGIKSFFETTFGNIQDFFIDTWDEIVGFLGRIPERISAAASGLFDGIKTAFKSALNFVIRSWNSLSFTVPPIRAFGQEIGGFTLGVPKIPELANGAIIRTPTLALVGEAGPEAVIPLNRPQRAQELLNQSGLAGSGGLGRSGPVVSINQATFVTPMDAEAIAQKINASVLARAS